MKCWFLLFVVASVHYCTGDVRETIRDTVVDFLEEHPELKYKWVESWSQRDRTAGEYALVNCVVCQGIVGLANTALEEGLDYPDLREELIDLCHFFLANFSSYNYEIMCPGIMDNFSPHVFNILKIRNMTGEYVCTKINSCESDEEVKPAVKRDVRENSVMRNRHKKTMNKQLGRGPNGTFVVAHLTDIHVDLKYLEGSPVDCNLPTCCHGDLPGDGSANYWGEYECNMPPRTGEVFFQTIADMNPRPDFILYTGDTPSHALWEETQGGQLNFSKWLADSFRQYLPGVRVFPAIGNHETFPTNMYFGRRPDIQDFNRKVAGYYQDLAGFGQQQMDTFHDAGYYSLQVLPGLWIVGYNSNYGYNSNWYNVLNDDEPEWANMTRFMEREFSNIRDLGAKIILVGHHPFGTDGIMRFYETFIYSIIERYHDTIVLHVLGHTHNDEFRVVRHSTTGEAVSVQNVGPTLGPKSNQNPAARLYYLEPASFIVQEINQYYFNLTAYTSFDQEPELNLLYTASSEYNMMGFSPSDWLDLTNRFENDWDLYNKYRANSQGRSGRDGSCDEGCRKRDLCRMRSATAAQTKACMEAAKYYINSASSLMQSIITISIFLSLLLLRK